MYVCKLCGSAELRGLFILDQLELHSVAERFVAANVRLRVDDKYESNFLLLLI